MGHGDGGALVIDWERGAGATLRAPIPPVSALALPLLTSLALREWVIVDGADTLEVCGHLFQITGWQIAPDRGFVVVHRCCGVTA